MKRHLLLILAVGFFVLCFNVTANAALVSYQFEGTINSTGFYMGSGYNPPLFSVGDDFSGTVTYDDSLPTNASLRKIVYQISNNSSGGGNSFQFQWSNFAGMFTNVDPLPGVLIYSVAFPPTYNNWALTFNDTQKAFSHNLNHALNGTELYAYNFNATLDSLQVVPIPGAAWLLGAGLIGLAGLRRKIQR